VEIICTYITVPGFSPSSHGLLLRGSRGIFARPGAVMIEYDNTLKMTLNNLPQWPALPSHRPSKPHSPPPAPLPSHPVTSRVSVGSCGAAVQGPAAPRGSSGSPAWLLGWFGSRQRRPQTEAALPVQLPELLAAAIDPSRHYTTTLMAFGTGTEARGHSRTTWEPTEALSCKV